MEQEPFGVACHANHHRKTLLLHVQCNAATHRRAGRYAAARLAAAAVRQDRCLSASPEETERLYWQGRAAIPCCSTIGTVDGPSSPDLAMDKCWSEIKKVKTLKEKVSK